MSEREKLDLATQQLINLKWWLSELTKHTTQIYVFQMLTILAGDTRKVIDVMLSDNPESTAEVSKVNA